MIDPKAEPIGHRTPYKRVDLGKRPLATVVCEDCTLRYSRTVGDYCPKCGWPNK